MLWTPNFNFKKPERTDAALIDDINDNMDIIDTELAAPGGNASEMTEAFTSSDTPDSSANAWTAVTPLASGEKHRIMFAKISQMFKNIRYLYKLLGTTDISSIGNGTVTGGLSSLNDSFQLRDLTSVRFYRENDKISLIYFRNASSGYQLVLFGSGNDKCMMQFFNGYPSNTQYTTLWRITL